jgi:hypothetical protein
VEEVMTFTVTATHGRTLERAIVPACQRGGQQLVPRQLL